MSRPPSLDRLDDEELIGRLVDEFTDRLNRGESPDIEACAREHPRVADLLRELLAPLVVMREAQRPAARNAQPSAPCSLPERVGPYRILREIDRGGMGVVYEAEHQQLRRRVALKVLLRPLGSERFRLRFVREARAAARLHHTHIVPVYEAGESEGVHYIAMQYIAGQSLDRVVRARLQHNSPRAPRAGRDSTPRGRGAEGGLTMVANSREPTDRSADGQHAPPAADLSPLALASALRAEYFAAVARIGRQAAEALAYAHTQGVLHRDIKPSNLLVDRQGAAWLTDFGLAKTADEDMTHSGDLLGTLRYMAPERFRGMADQRSDVYGLGVTLYELLTLRPAFGDSDQAQLVRRITDESPRRPRTIDGAIARDLETIVLKAMAKEPRDRYASAPELASDLQRYLDCRPIAARRTSALNSAWHWVRRNPTAAGLAACAVLMFVVGFAATWWQWRRAEGNLAQLWRQQEFSQQSFEHARQAVDDLVNAVNDESLLGDPTLRPVQRRLLEQALTYYRGFINQRGDDPSARADLLESQSQIARILDVLGSPDADLAALTEQLKAAQEQAQQQPDSIPRRLKLAGALTAVGKEHFGRGATDEALEYYQRSVAVCASVLSGHGENSGALTSMISAHLELGNLHSRLERSALELGHFAQACEVSERLVRTEPANPQHRLWLATSYMRLGMFHNNKGQSVNLSLTFLERAKTVYAELATENPNSGLHRGNLARVCNRIGDVYLVHRPDEQWDEHAVSAYADAQAIEEELARAQPGSRLRLSPLANTQFNQGEVHHLRQRWDRALRFFQQARDTYRQLIDLGGATIDAHFRLGGAHHKAAECLERLGRDEEALAAYTHAVQEQFLAVRGAPDVPRYRAALSDALRARATLAYSGLAD